MNLPFEQYSAAGLFDEARDHRDSIDIAANFQVTSSHFTFDGVSLSRTSLAVKAIALNVHTLERQEITVADIGEQDQQYKLRIKLSGFVLEIDLMAAVLLDPPHGDGIIRFYIRSMSDKNQIAFNRVIRAFMTGILPTIDDIIRHHDAETPLAKNKPPPPEQTRRWQTVLVSGLTMIFLLAMMLYAGLSIYSSMHTIKAKYAVLTAPKIDLYSTINGRLETIESPYQSSVNRDQVLYRMESSDIDAEIHAVRARIQYYAAIDSDTRTGKVSLTSLELSSAVAPQAIHARDLEQGLLISLQLKKAMRTMYSPCDCDVVWAIDEGSSVRVGDRIMTLAKTGDEDIRIEAMLNYSDALDVHPGQEAYASIPGRDITVRAHVESVRLDGNLPPRVGFPDHRRKDPEIATVILRLTEPLHDIAAGSPLEVTIRK